MISRVEWKEEQHVSRHRSNPPGRSTRACVTPPLSLCLLLSLSLFLLYSSLPRPLKSYAAGGRVDVSQLRLPRVEEAHRVP